MDSNNKIIYDNNKRYCNFDYYSWITNIEI